MSGSSLGPIGILAGGGPFPGRVADAALAAGRAVFIVGFEDFAEPAVIGGYPHAYARLGAAGKILSLLREQGVHGHRARRPRPAPLATRPAAGRRSGQADGANWARGLHRR